ncbi:hypothetical protein I7I51_08408 [Histoplasma capsulatum]|uniref:Uncharacterized protein n=1 Tax=Ajellomyces capsulatus TaxID=5037 RepID=A0A8A1M463_AJECA|nr:predicted protein [Histoplasma mississippiense (nom. inval.)]EDN03328.1 predicted protein [Histoplasma mississippiense (nom. inval.)]QSS58977.1 hypothetical protein I7I51_08408 [Histoplasma capsulatum]
MSTSLFVQVHMNKVDFDSFADGQLKRSVGTRNLNSCTAVAFVSGKGVILAHISPLPGLTNDPDVSEKHVRGKMAEFLDLYIGKKCFRLEPNIKKAGIFCGIYMGQIALPDQVKFIESVLLENLEDNPRPRVISYLINPGGHSRAAEGIVFIDGRHPTPKVFVEDTDQGWF